MIVLSSIKSALANARALSIFKPIMIYTTTSDVTFKQHEIECGHSGEPRIGPSRAPSYEAKGADLEA
jgi:hypothetical protein